MHKIGLSTKESTNYVDSSSVFIVGLKYFLIWVLFASYGQVVFKGKTVLPFLLLEDIFGSLVESRIF